MPQSLLGGLPVCHQRIFLNIHSCINSSRGEKKVRINSFSHTCKEPSYTSDGEQKLSRCCDCAILKRNFKTQRPRPRNGLIFMSNMKRSQRCQTDKDWPGSQGLRLHTPQTHSEWADIFRPHLETPHCTYTYEPYKNATHSLAHEALATWYLNLPPGREWKICHSCYLLHSHVQRWPTAGWIAPLCSMMQRNGWRPAVIYLLCCGVYRGLGGWGYTHWNHSAQSHFTVVWNPELSCVAFLYRLLACAVRSSTSLLPAAWLRAKHKSDKRYKA